MKGRQMGSGYRAWPRAVCVCLGAGAFGVFLLLEEGQKIVAARFSSLPGYLSELAVLGVGP